LPPVVRQTSARSRESNSSTPCEASMTSGPDIASRPMSLMTRWSAQRATMPIAAEAAVGAADEDDHRDAGGAGVEQRAHHLRNRDQAGIGLVQANATRFGEQEHRVGSVAQGALEEADQLGAVHLADAAAHELPFLGADEHASIG
jgi:hypothetical protein